MNHFRQTLLQTINKTLALCQLSILPFIIIQFQEISYFSKKIKGEKTKDGPLLDWSFVGFANRIGVGLEIGPLCFYLC